MKNKKIVIHNEPDFNKARDRRKADTVFTDATLKISSLLRDYAKGKRYFIRTYGCQANVRDSETMMGILEEIGFVHSDDYNEADVIIINTCAVRENAEDKVFGEVGSLKSLKAKRPGLIVAVGGCMVQQGVIVDTLKDKYAQVDLIFGTHNIEYLPDYLNEIITTRKRIIDVISKPGEVIENLPSVRIDRYKAFVNIIYGCDKFCTYCIVPYTRGRERSRKKEEVIKECQQLVADGYQEITLLGQNVNAYGKDLTDGTDFAELLEAVAKLGIPRLRFTTSHPWDFSSKMIEVIGKYSNIMKAIHLPFQSGNANILRRMGRRYTPDSYRALVDEMKAKIPGVSFTTDIIVGFPNETYEEFCDTKKMVEYVEFDNAFTFIYSPRPGTPASKLEDNVSEEEKHRRFDELVDTVEKCATLKAEQMVGKIYPILVDSVSKRNDEVMSGYTENNKLVNFPGTVDLIGKIVNVRILESKVYSLRGELVSE